MGAPLVRLPLYDLKPCPSETTRGTKKQTEYNAERQAYMTSIPDSILFVRHVVLFQFPVQGGFAYSQHARGGQFIAGSFAQGLQNSAPFQFFQRQDFIMIRQPLAG